MVRRSLGRQGFLIEKGCRSLGIRNTPTLIISSLLECSRYKTMLRAQFACLPLSSCRNTNRCRRKTSRLCESRVEHRHDFGVHRGNRYSDQAAEVRTGIVIPVHA